MIVGAGYDDRALRLRHADVRFLEIDEPVTQAHKRRRLEGLGLLGYAEYVAVDLAHDSIAAALVDHVASDVPTFVMAEAVFPYVPESGIRRTLSELSQLSDRVSLAVDLATNPVTWQGRVALRAVKLGAGGGGEVIESVMDDGTARHIVTEAGWTVTSAEDLADLGLPQLAGSSLFIRASNT